MIERIAGVTGEIGQMLGRQAVEPVALLAFEILARGLETLLAILYVLCPRQLAIM
jgi:hypothetical protein